MRGQQPRTAKERYKWLVALRESGQHKPANTPLISGGDADRFERFEQARPFKTDLLMRAAQNRAVCEPEVASEGHPRWPVLEKQPIRGHLKVHVAKRPALPR